MIEYVADGTHESLVVLMLFDAHVTLRERQVALLEFANSVQIRFKSSVADELFPDNWPVIAAGAARFDTDPPGKVYDFRVFTWSDRR